MTVNTTQLVSSNTSRREASSLLRGAIENQRKEARRSEAVPIEIAHYAAGWDGSNVKMQQNP